MITKKGDKMARFILEDATGGIEVVCFPKTFEKVRHVLVSDEPILCSGEVKNEGGAEQADWKMMMNDAVPMAELRQAKTTRVDIHLNADSITTDQVSELRAILAQVPRGNCQAYVRLRISQRSETVIPLGDTWQVAPSDELLTRLERIFGERVAVFG
jgi:DNA polymerase-3 subunit alpha